MDDLHHHDRLGLSGAVPTRQRTFNAAEVIALRIRAQQLDRPVAGRPLTDAAIYDLGIQDTGRDSASWALVNRGVPVASSAELERCPDVALVWSVRASPHYYRREDLLDVLTATSPFSEQDAAKRVIGADQPLKAAGISTCDGLSEVASQLRRLVASPTVKGELSTRLTATLDPPYLRECVPCQAVHSWEIPFRLGTFYGGLELEPGTSPPVLHRIPGWPRRVAGPAADPMAAPDRLQVIRGYLRFLGPATPQDVAGYLDAAVADIKAHWPEDALDVDVEGKRVWMLGDPSEPAVESSLVRLLGPYDLLLQGRDRHLLVQDKAHHQALWPVIGRPGAVLSGAQIIGTWRPKAAGKKFSVPLDTWSEPKPALRSRIEQQAGLLAAHRGLTFAGLVSA